MQAVILSIGDELALGQVVDTNAAWLAAMLAGRGIVTAWQMTVPDDRHLIAQALRDAAGRGQIVIGTGGLGPTDDDLTRFSLADVMQCDLALDETALQRLEEFFASRGRQMPDRNRVQTMCPAHAKLLDNPVGTAPVITATIDNAMFFMLPGVPREMMHLFELYIDPWLSEQAVAGGGKHIVTSLLHTFGVGESTIAELLGDLCDRNRNPLVGTTVSGGIVSVRIRSQAADAANATRMLRETEQAVRAALGVHYFGDADVTLAEAVGKLLTQAGKTVCTAESCTGGLVGTMLTETPGSSSYFHGGFITYTNEAKHRDLSVDRALLAEHGAVSKPVARAMAEGAITRFDCDYALALTGIAGPDADGTDKPVGLVWIAMARKRRKTIVREFRFTGDRNHIRHYAARTALNLLRYDLLKHEGDGELQAGKQNQ